MKKNARASEKRGLSLCEPTGTKWEYQKKRTERDGHKNILKYNGWIKTLIYTCNELNEVQTEQMQNESHSDVL